MKNKFCFLIVCGFLFPFLVFGAEITVITMAIGEKYQDAVSKSIENKRSYCEKHGYDFVYGKERLDPSRPISWTKIPLILQVMETSDCSWIFWTDADSLITNSTMCLEDIIDNRYNFILTKDLNALNAGQFLIKNCEWSRNFLRTVYTQTDCIHHPWWETQAIIKLFENKPEYLSFTKILPQRVMNSYAEELIGRQETHTFQPGDFIIHFASVRSLEFLKSLMDQYSQESK